VSRTPKIPTTVLVHGGFADASFWRPIKDLQARDQPVLTPATPAAHMPSTSPVVTTTSAALAADLGVDEADIAVVLEQLGEGERDLPDDLAAFLRGVLDPHGERSTPDSYWLTSGRPRRVFGLGPGPHRAVRRAAQIARPPRSGRVVGSASAWAVALCGRGGSRWT
jgi:hypothetical protein